MKEVNSLYIHFPFCQHLCNYCDFYKHKLIGAQQIVEFEQKLATQMEDLDQYLAKQGRKLGSLETLYIGGGTPSLWKSAPDFLKGKFPFKANYEFSIEVDPDTWTEEEIDYWLELGVNRFSIGSQAYSEKFIATMDRTHSKVDVEKTIKYFSERDLNFSVDLMLGLPNSHDRDIESEIKELLRYNPNHFSVYILKTRANYPLKDNLPEDEYIREEYLKTSRLLQSAGYRHYEVSNFARNGYESKHNKQYWDYESVAALGSNATGLTVCKDKAIRYQWKSVGEGVTEEVIEGESLIIEKLFLGLRHKCNFNVSSVLPGQESVLREIVKSWIQSGYVEEGSDYKSLNLTPLGFIMCDSLLDDIFKQVNF